MQQANGKRSLKFTKASQAQPSTALHSPAQPCTTLHGPSLLFVFLSVACFACTARVILFVLFSPACFACTALVCFWFSSRPPASLCTALVIFSFSLRSLTSLARPSLSFRSLFGHLGTLLGHFLLLLGPLGRSWGALGTKLQNHQKNDPKNDRCWLPKWSPKRAKIGPKTDQNR